MDGKLHDIDGMWDLVIAHPPCTYLTVSGNAWYNEEKYHNSARARYLDRIDGISFFMKFAMCNAKRLAIENPVGIMSSVYRKPDQVIQPWQFGHPETKQTCLWLRNLPQLEPTNIVEGREQRVWKMPPSADRSALRSKTFEGIAQAMAEQWGNMDDAAETD